MNTDKVPGANYGKVVLSQFDVYGLIRTGRNKCETIGPPCHFRPIRHFQGSDSEPSSSLREYDPDDDIVTVASQITPQAVPESQKSLCAKSRNGNDNSDYDPTDLDDPHLRDRRASKVLRRGVGRVVIERRRGERLPKGMACSLGITTEMSFPVAIAIFAFFS
ncbi:hypothetical protein BKA82DRAFT_4020504 [Pisolithus tinctorius]|nr:hypothetical protein BKA82DRAFT_4020504 [Pisolithus tinctorius]